MTPTEPRSQPSRARRLAIAVVLGFAPVVAFAPTFGRTDTSALLDPAYVAPTAGTVAGTAILTLLLARLAPTTRTLIVLIALIAPAALLLRAFDGPKGLLTSALPLDPAGPELAAVCVLCGLAALGALEGALRRTSPVLPLVAPVIVTALGCAMGNPTPWLGPAIVLAALIMLWRRWAATALVVLILASTALAPTLLQNRSHFDPRTLVPQPVRPLVDTSPLAQFAAIQSGRLPLSARVESDFGVTRLRYMSLDSFDGDYWTSTTTYRRAGLKLPRPNTTTATTGLTTVERVTIDRAGPLGWLLSSGRPTEVSVSGLGVDETGGEVVFPDDRPPPASYTVHSTVPAWSEETLTAAIPASMPPPAKPLPPDLTQAAQRIVGHEYGHPALSLLADHFARDASGYGVAEPREARSGHGLLHIRQLLADRQGSAEQYASAFAVLARSLGYDTRVTVGFVPRAEAGAYVVAGRDIDAWAEVRFEGVGWVPYFPTPGQHASPAERPKVPEPVPTPAAPDSPDQVTEPGAPAAETPIAREFPFTYAFMAVGALILVLPLIAPTVKLLRRRRRRRAEVLGAWRDTVDRFHEAGLPTPPSATASELAEAAATRFTPTLRGPATELARMYDAAAFGQAEHGKDGTTAWRHATDIRTALRRSLPRRRRLAAALSPRTLIRRG